MEKTRRDFIKWLGALCLVSASPLLAQNSSSRKKLVFGVISDVHKDLQPDAERRLQIFIDKCRREKPDFIIQLGDLTHGQGMDAMMKIWNRFPGKKYHVLGNHDMDHATKEEVVKKLGMPDKYYSFDMGGYHFVVLDANFFMKDGQYHDNSNGNYFKYPKTRDMVSPEELEWLKKDLAATKLPCLLFSHEAFDDIWQGGTSPSKMEVRKIIREANEAGEKNGTGKKVIACFCGHHHLDNHSVIEGVHYFQINSASNYWIDQASVFSNGHMAEFKDPLFAFVTLDPAGKSISVKGTKSSFLPPAPTKETYPDADRLYPGIKDRVVKY